MGLEYGSGTSWYTPDTEKDYTTGEETTYGYHIQKATDMELEAIEKYVETDGKICKSKSIPSEYVAEFIKRSHSSDPDYYDVDTLVDEVYDTFDEFMSDTEEQDVREYVKKALK